MEELLILRETEFQLLAAALDFTRIYGIPPKESPDEATAMYLIHEMAAKGILREEADRLRLMEPYRTTIQAMKRARWILSVSEVQTPLSNVCFYIGDMVACLEESHQDESSVKIGLFDLQALYSQLSDRELLPDDLWPDDIIELREQEELSLEKREIYARFQIFAADGNGEACRNFYLFKSAGDYWVSECEAPDSESTHYNKEIFFEQLLEFLK